MNRKSRVRVLDVLTNQRDACRSPVHVPVLTAAGLHPDRWLELLTPAVKALGEAIYGGTFGETLRNETASALEDAVLKLDIVLSRAVVWIEDWVSLEAAALFEADVPRRHERGGAAKDGTEEEGPDEVDGDETEGEGEEVPGASGAGEAPAPTAAGGATTPKGADVAGEPPRNGGETK